MSLFKQYGTDEKAELNGVWVGLGDNEDGTEIEVLLSRTSDANKPYKKAIRKAVAPISRQLEMETISEEKSESIFRSVFATKVLLGWRNVRDEDDNEIEYNKENAIKLLTDLPELYKELKSKANSALIFKKDSLEADLKN